MAATITYNGNTTEVGNGKTATLSCSGKKALTPISVNFATAGSITYNGSTTDVEAGKTATLQCAGKKMISDVYVTAEERALLSGKYEFVNTPDFSGIPFGTKIAVKASYAGTFTYSDIIEISFHEGSQGVANQIIIKRSTGNTHFIYIGNSVGWQGSNVINFLDEPQEVPLLFYGWVMANAKKVE